MRPTEIKAEHYNQQLKHKIQTLELEFSEFTTPELEVFTSRPLYYRMRAEFRVWHEGDELFHIMFDPDTKQRFRVEHFPPASKLINQVMQDLLVLLKPNPTLRERLFQIDYLSTLSDQILVTLTYHRQLDEAWQRAIEQLKDKLSRNYNIHFVGRARKQKRIHEQDFVIESLPINGRNYQFKQIENSFTQPNARVNSKMIEWALDVSRGLPGDLLELYCGLGNFSLPLAQNFDRVLATEISKTSVAAAQFNIAANGIENVKILRMSSEEFVQAVNGERNFRRLQGVDLSTYDCKTVLIDPPRAGLDNDTVKMVQGYENIIYISCNPDTLKANLQVLQHSHAIKRFALFDQFPYTHHAEVGVFLQRVNAG